VYSVLADEAKIVHDFHLIKQYKEYIVAAEKRIDSNRERQSLVPLEAPLQSILESSIPVSVPGNP
jgi:hypothetical protein